MAQLKEEEFERLQNQLLELKTSNYSLSDGIKRKDGEISLLRQEIASLQKDLSSVKSRMAKFSLNSLNLKSNLGLGGRASNKQNSELTQESLQRKMDSQEEEFRISNEMLRSEISSLMQHNSRLKDLLARHGVIPSDDSDDVQHVDSSDMTGGGDSSFDVSGSSEGIMRRTGGISAGGGGSSAKRSPEKVDPKKFSIMTENELLKNKISDLEFSLKKSESDKSLVQKSLEDLSDSFESVSSQLRETQKTLDQRSLLLDEMKEHLDQVNLKHRMEMARNSEETDSRIRQLTERIGQLEAELTDFQSTRQLLEEFREELSQTIRSRHEVMEEKKILQESLESSRKELEAQKTEFHLERVRQLDQMAEGHAAQVEELKALIRSKDQEISGLKEELAGVRSQVSDSLEERRVNEKKGILLVKEFKKQIKEEKAKNEKLQKKLQEFLNSSSLLEEGDPAAAGGGYYLSNSSFRSSSSVVVAAGGNGTGGNGSGPKDNPETSSVGSWSFIKRANRQSERNRPVDGNGSDGTKSSSGSTSGDIRSSSDHNCRTTSPHHNMMTAHNTSAHNHPNLLSTLESENSQLLARISKVQEEKWLLEETINGLRVDLRNCQEELSTKQKVIEFYCMGSGAGQPIPAAAAAVGRAGSTTPTLSSPSDRRTSFGSSGLKSPSTEAKSSGVKKVFDGLKSAITSSNMHHHHHHLNHGASEEKNFREMNSRLQRMLEETLTKNIFLSQDVETLSRELQDLKEDHRIRGASSGPAAGGGGSSCPGAVQGAKSTRESCSKQLTIDSSSSIITSHHHDHDTDDDDDDHKAAIS